MSGCLACGSVAYRPFRSNQDGIYPSWYGGDVDHLRDLYHRDACGAFLHDRDRRRRDRGCRRRSVSISSFSYMLLPSINPSVRADSSFIVIVLLLLRGGDVEILLPPHTLLLLSPPTRPRIHERAEEPIDRKGEWRDKITTYCLRVLLKWVGILRSFVVD